MAEDASSHQYEDIRIGENAVVHLGDQRVTNKKEINIQTAYLFLQNELDLPQLNIAQVLPSACLKGRHLDSKLRSRCEETTQIERQSSTRNRPERPQRDVALSNATASKTGSRLQVGFPTPTEHSSNQSHGTSWMRRFLPHFVASSKRHDVGSIQGGGGSGSVTQDGQLTKNDTVATTLVQPGQEFLALLTFVLSCLIGRNASPQEISAILTKCQHDPLLPLLTAALAFAVARYLQNARIKPNPSCFDELKITLEDAYGIRSFVSMSICADYSLFKSFLEVHYRKAGRKAGEMLVQADQFHLTLGSRRGALMDADNWEVEKGSNIVNSLYVVTEDQSCLLCKGSLIVGKTGDLHCLECHVFFRDYDTFRPRIRTVRKARRLAPFFPCAESANVQQTLETLDYVEYLDDTQIELEGLQHIDIRIAPTHSRQQHGVKAARSSQEPELRAHNVAHVSEDMVPEKSSSLARGVQFQNGFVGEDEGEVVQVEIHKNLMEPGRRESEDKPKGILKRPREIPFPEDPNPIREGILPTNEAVDPGIPPGARWTKIRRILVNPEALEMAHERFEEREDYVIVLRVLSRDEIQALAEKTKQIREERAREERSIERLVEETQWRRVIAPDERMRPRPPHEEQRRRHRQQRVLPKRRGVPKRRDIGDWPQQREERGRTSERTSDYHRSDSSDASLTQERMTQYTTPTEQFYRDFP